MNFENIGSYTIEGAGALLIVVLAYKLYKARVVSESDCCHHAVRLRTSNRGDSNTDLEMHTIDSD
jgi:hypothetical protein